MGNDHMVGYLNGSIGNFLSDQSSGTMAAVATNQYQNHQLGSLIGGGGGGAGVIGISDYSDYHALELQNLQYQARMQADMQAKQKQMETERQKIIAEAIAIINSDGHWVHEYDYAVDGLKSRFVPKRKEATAHESNYSPKGPKFKIDHSKKPS